MQKINLPQTCKDQIRADAKTYANRIAAMHDGAYEDLREYYWMDGLVCKLGYLGITERYEINASTWNDFTTLFESTCDAVVEGLISGKRTGRYAKGYRKNE